MTKKFVPTEAQLAKAKMRRDKFQVLANQVRAMDQDEIQATADLLGIRNLEEHELSPYNQVLISMQRESCTVVAGFVAWKKAGRTVVKGEPGIGIWVPSEKAKPDAPKPEDPKEVFFFMRTVWDISQTKELDNVS